MEEDYKFLLILGRLFVKTTKVIIDVDKDKLKICVHDDESAKPKMFSFKKVPSLSFSSPY